MVGETLTCASLDDFVEDARVLDRTTLALSMSMSSVVVLPWSTAFARSGTGQCSSLAEAVSIHHSNK